MATVYVVLYTDPAGVSEVSSRHRTRAAAVGAAHREERRSGGGWDFRVRRTDSDHYLDHFTGQLKRLRRE